MKFKKVYSHKLPKKRLLFVVALLLLVVSGFVLMSYRSARAASAQVKSALKASQAPNPDQFTVKERVYLEITQRGPYVTLYSPEVWTKVYFDPASASKGIVGIYDGVYTGCGVDYNGSRAVNGSSAISTCADQKTAVQYDFFAARDIQYGGGSSGSDLYIDEGRCAEAFTSINSGSMASQDWDTISLADISPKYNKNYLTSGCDGEAMPITKKTGKIVVFVRARWKSSEAGNTEGRINAYKVGGAYSDGKSALVGYWSTYGNSTNPSPADTGAVGGSPLPVGEYAVQDRSTNVNEQGNYSFSFGPDCYLAKDKVDRKRYLKWYDVDFSNDPSKSFYNNLTVPFFYLQDITSGKVVELTDLNGKKFTEVRGTDLGGPDTFRQMSFNGQGGHIYAWRWRNIVQKDGIVFWMPYDDFPAMGIGCGKFNYTPDMRAGAGSVGYDDFKAYGGQTVRVNLSQLWNSTTNSAGAAVTSTLNIVASSTGATINNGFSKISTSDKDFVTSNTVSSVNRRITWSDMPKLGPAPLPRSRDVYADLTIQDSAIDGSKYCFSSSVAPSSESNANAATWTRNNKNNICVTIDNSLKPFVNTLGGDVHAGDCNVTSGALKQIYGNVSQSGSLGSSGTYVVSAGGAISQFGSGGAPLGSNLTLGKGGLYGDMCRPRFADMAKEIKDPVPVTDTYDLGQIKAPGTIQFASNGRITGTSKYRVTVYAPKGTVTIGGSTFGGDTKNSYSRENLPVVGVLAQNIKIEPGVSTINAILYASLNIDTCAGPDIKTTGGVAACKGKLTLKGFAMAHDFSFKRTTGANGLNESELLQFNAAYYLNPPDGFKKAAGLVKYLGERAPLY